MFTYFTITVCIRKMTYSDNLTMRLIESFLYDIE